MSETVDSSRDAAFERWKMGRCRYRCQICHKLFANSLRFHFHAASDHGLDSLQYRRKHGRARIGSHWLACALCREQVLHDYVKLRVHMEKKHDCMDLRQYFMQYVYQNPRRERDDEEESDSPEREESSFTRGSNAGCSKAVRGHLLENIKEGRNDEKNDNEVEEEVEEELPDLDPSTQPGPSATNSRQKLEYDDVSDDDWSTSEERQSESDTHDVCNIFEHDESPLNTSENDDVEISPEKPEGYNFKDKTREDQREYSTNVANLCSYRCSKCKATYDKWTVMKSHNIRMPCGTGNSKFNISYLVHEVYHVCKICGKKVLCDKAFLTWHVRTHKLTLETYVKMFKLKNINKKKIGNVKKGNKVKPTQNKKALKNKTPTSKPPKIIDDTESSLLAGPVLNIVGDFCYYRCAKSCDKRFSNWTALSAHHAIDHGTRVSFDIRFVLKATYHKCWVCSKVLYCDEDLIRRHTRKHFTWEEYLKGCPPGGRRVEWVYNACIFTCQGCHAVVPNYRAVTKVTHDCQRGPSIRAWSPVSELIHVCAICSAELWCDETKVYRHVTAAHSVSWENYKNKCPDPPLASQKNNN